MSYETKHRDVQQMFGEIAPRYDLANSVLSGGTHYLWKTDFVQNISWTGIGSPAVLDLCTGTGDLTPLLARRFSVPVVGGDFCDPMLNVARERYKDRADLSFAHADAMALTYADASFDIVTVAFGVRNFENLTKGLEEIYRILKPGGVVAVLEFGQPSLAPFAAVYNLYSRHIMPVIGKALTGNRAAYEYLPRTASRFPSGEVFLQILSESGFTKTRLKSYMLGIAYAYYASKP